MRLTFSKATNGKKNGCEVPFRIIESGKMCRRAFATLGLAICVLVLLCGAGCSKASTESASTQTEVNGGSSSAESVSAEYDGSAEGNESGSAASVDLDINDPSDRALVNGLLDYFSQSMHASESISSTNGDIQVFADIIVRHLGLYDEGAWERGDYGSLVGNAGYGQTANARVKANVAERIGSQLLGVDADFSILGNDDGKRYKYYDGYIYFATTAPPGQTASYASVTEIEKGDENTYKLKFDVLSNGMPFGCDANGGQLIIDDRFFSLDTASMEQELGTSGASLEGRATVRVSEEAGEKTLVMVSCALDDYSQDAGFANTGSEYSDEDDDELGDYEYDEEGWGEGDYDEGAYTIDDVVMYGEEGLWVEDGDTGVVEEVMSTYKWSEAEDKLIAGLNSEWCSELINFSLGQKWEGPVPEEGDVYQVENAYFPHVSKSSGDRLLVVSSVDDIDDSNMATIACSGFFQGTNIAGNGYETVGGVDASELDGEDYINERKRFEEALDLMLLRYTHQSFMFCSAESRVLEATWYEGTKYCEGVIRLETPYVLETDYLGRIDFEKTKDGYLVVNIDSLQPGIYSFLIRQDSRPWYIGHVVYIDE